MFTSVFDIVLILEILKRIAFGAFCGACIGFERDVHGRAAGLRTHTLVAAGAALFTQASLICAGCPLDFPGHEALHGDVCRIAAQIVSGIGFIGAGTIVKSGFTVKGLTTAACLWFAAALGMTCGINQIPVAIIVTFSAMLIIFVGKKIERKLHRLFPFQLIVEAPDYSTIEQLKKYISQCGDSVNKTEKKTIKRPSYTITTLNITTFSDPAFVKAFFFIDANQSQEQIESCLTLMKDISEQFPCLKSVSYKSEG